MRTYAVEAGLEAVWLEICDDSDGTAFAANAEETGSWVDTGDLKHKGFLYDSTEYMYYDLTWATMKWSIRW